MRPTILAAFTAALTTTACGDVFFDNGYPNFEGYYTYVGAVEDAPGEVVEGWVRITAQHRNTALVRIDWDYTDGYETIVRITSDRAAEATVYRDGTIQFDFVGDLSTGEGPAAFTLTHDGRLRGHTISGSWRLTTDLPTDDRGTFVAAR